jgi:DNA-binding transcriptional MerR regulator
LTLSRREPLQWFQKEENMLLKIGELAKQTGLTIRALRHYDDIGLLSPSIRSDAGYRLYDRADVARLHGIQALKQLGLDLAGIGDLLDGGAMPLPELIARQLTARAAHRAGARPARSAVKAAGAIGAWRHPEAGRLADHSGVNDHA